MMIDKKPRKIRIIKKPKPADKLKQKLSKEQDGSGLMPAGQGGNGLNPAGQGGSGLGNVPKKILKGIIKKHILPSIAKGIKSHMVGTPTGVKQ